MAPRARLTLAAALALAGCKPRLAACDASLEPSVVVSDASGALELALRRQPPVDPPADPAARDLCDGAGRLLGRVTVAPGRVELDNAAGDPVARVEARGRDDATLTLLDPAKPALDYRLHDDRGLLRVLDGAGVPLGQLSRSDGKALALDAGGTPVATAERAGERVAIRSRDGAVERYVAGIADPRASAALALPPFAPAVRFALALFLSR